MESGEYDPDPKYAPFPTAQGDVMLLYCTGSYGKYTMEIPGVGIVLDTNRQWIKYRWLPFNQPIAKARIDQAFEPADGTKFANIRFSSHWLFEISPLSFSKVVAAQLVDWGKL